MAKKEGAEKLAQFKADASKAVLPALLVSRDQPQGVSPQIVAAVLRANARFLPAWVGIDQGAKGYALSESINWCRARRQRKRPRSRTVSSTPNGGQQQKRRPTMAR
jgi:hypothetical protein